MIDLTAEEAFAAMESGAWMKAAKETGGWVGSWAELRYIEWRHNEFLRDQLDINKP